MKRYIKSVVDTTISIETFMDNLQSIYYNKFPNSLCRTNFGRLLGDPFVMITCYLAKDKEEVSSGILDNDVFDVKATFDFRNAPRDLSADEPMPEQCELSFLGRSIMTVPTVDYLYCDYSRINVRKTVGNVDKMLKTWEKFVNNLYDETVKLYQSGRLHKNASEYYNVEDKL